MRIPAKWFLSAFLLITQALVLSSPVSGQSVPQIVTQVQHAGRDLTIYANGIPVAQATGEMSSHIFQIGSFLTSGENVIRFEWVRTDAQAMAFSAVVQENILPEGLTDLVTIDAVEDDVVGEVSVREVTVEVSLPQPWAWEAGEPINLDSAVRAGVTEAVRELHGAFARGDADRAVALTELMWTEMSGFRDGFVDRILERYEGMVAEAGWSVAPLNEDGMVIDAFGPLVRVVTDGPLIQSAPLEGGGRLSIVGLFFAHIDGQWTPVRPVS